MAFTINLRGVTRVAAATLAALALAAPAATARPIIDPPTHASTERVPATVDVTPKAANDTSDGFDWASAGVGAAAAGGLILIAAGAFGVAYRARMRLAP
jgi:hypothetical protein